MQSRRRANRGSSFVNGAVSAPFKLPGKEEADVSREALPFWFAFCPCHRLYTKETLPQTHSADNDFIPHGYRVNWTWTQAAISIFQLHNESLNIWSHLAGLILFLTLMAAVALQPGAHFYMHEAGEALKTASSHFADAAHSAAESAHGVAHRVVGELEGLAGLAHEGLHALEGFAHDGRVAGEAAVRHAGQAAARHARHARHAGAPLPELQWPMVVFLTCACYCMGASTFCHAFYCVSQRISAIIWRFDYCGIAVMIAGSFVPPVSYAFRCAPGWRNFYLSAIFALAVLTTAVSLPERFQGSEWRKPRAALFSGLGLFGIFPVLHQLFFYWDTIPPPVLSALSWEGVMGGCYLLGATVYASRVPERWVPGWFCYGFHSHSVFHLLVVAAAYVHYHACTILLAWRSAQSCEVDKMYMRAW